MRASSSRFTSHRLGCRPSANGSFPFQEVPLVGIRSHAPPSLNQFLGSGNKRFRLSGSESADHPVTSPWPWPESASPRMEPWVLFPPPGMDGKYCREEDTPSKGRGTKTPISLLTWRYLPYLNHSYISTFEDNGFQQNHDLHLSHIHFAPCCVSLLLAPLRTQWP